MAEPNTNTSSSTATVPASSPDPLAGVPELTTFPATTEDHKVEALHLLADSVAQQRQLAGNAILMHPISFAIMALILGLIYQYFYRGSYSDWGLIGTTFAGCTMIWLVSVRKLTGPYLYEAERIGTWKWLNEGRHSDDTAHFIVGDEDEILLSKFGDEYIGALILRGVKDVEGKNFSSVMAPNIPVINVSTSSMTNKEKKSVPKNHPTKGLIRGWTVQRRFRSKGVGTGLLEEAYRLCNERGWTGPEFAVDHANSAKLIPKVFLASFYEMEKRAQGLLERVLDYISVSVHGKKGKKR